MPSRRTRKQRGGGIDVVRAQEESIRQKEDELKFSMQDVSERELFDAINTAFSSQARPEEIKADIAFYTGMILKDERTIEDLFPNYEGVPAEYVQLIQVLGKYGKVRNDMDTLMKSIYRYIIDLRSAYPGGSGPNTNRSRLAGRTVTLNGRKFRNKPRPQEQGPPTAEGLPMLVNGYNNRDPQAPQQGEGPPILSRNNGGQDPNQNQGGPPQMASLHKSRRRRTFRKKN
jgi:hypothetical protein